MTAKLAKNANGGRRHMLATGSVAAKLEQLAAAEARSVLLAPADGPRPPQDNSRTAANELDRLFAALDMVTAENHPRTARLLGSSTRKVAQKVIEEAGEVALAAVKHNDRNIVRESADLLYQLAVLWRRAGIGPEQIWAEMRRRADTLGIAEKLPKSRDCS
jgi:phosphoribosyl-ATP pyrophosphohydrolase